MFPAPGPLRKAEIMQPDDDNLTPYYRLDPEQLIRLIESIGLICDGRLQALNSYENRVYQVGIEDAFRLSPRFIGPVDGQTSKSWKNMPLPWRSPPRKYH